MNTARIVSDGVQITGGTSSRSARSLDGRLFPLNYTKWEQVGNENVNAPLERRFDLIHKVLTTVKFAHEVSVPRVVKGMKRPGIDFSPIVNRHGESSLE